MSATAFIEARDFLLAHREQYERAYRDFRWPVLDRFNWALDYFDPMAQANNRPGLIPATTLLNRNDLVDRFERGQVRHVTPSASQSRKPSSH